MNEAWKSVTGYDGFYEVSNFGSVRSLTSSNGRKRFNRVKILKPAILKDGYLRVTLCVDSKKKQVPVHRLVLSAFSKDNPSLQVNHINGVKNDNRLCNLEWCTQSENQKHAYRIGLQVPVDNGLKKHVSMIKDGVTMKTFESIRDMCRKENLDRRAVQRVIDGKFSNHKGFTFKVGG